MPSPQFSPLHNEWIAKIKQHARDHYEQGGWDYVIECYSDQDIFDEMMVDSDLGPQPPATYEEALANVAAIVGVMDDRRKDVQAEIF